MSKNTGEKGPHDRNKRRPESGPSNIGVVDPDHLKESEEIAEKYTEGEDEVASNVIFKHPNRNLNKPEIDKPSYP